MEVFKMTKFTDYVSYGADSAELAHLLESSLSTRHHDKCDRVYVGVEASTKRVPDGSMWGRFERTVTRLVLLKMVQTAQGECYFYEINSGKCWHTGNGNTTLSPWDAHVPLKEVR
jgi:hypothetical protein